MVKVRFYGDLLRYGRVFKLDVMTAGEAIRALIYQIPDLRKHMSNDFYRVRIGKKDIANEDQLKMGMSEILTENSTIHIIPRAVGAKNGGVFSVIAGAALIVVGAVDCYFGQPWGASLIGAGVSMLAGGVAQMMTKLPETKVDDRTTSNNTSFSNLDNSIAQGQPIPLCYGEIMIGSKVLSQGLVTE